MIYNLRNKKKTRCRTNSYRLQKQNLEFLSKKYCEFFNVDQEIQKKTEREILYLLKQKKIFPVIYTKEYFLDTFYHQIHSIMKGKFTFYSKLYQNHQIITDLSKVNTSTNWFHYLALLRKNNVYYAKPGIIQKHKNSLKRRVNTYKNDGYEVISLQLFANCKTKCTPLLCHS